MSDYRSVHDIAAENMIFDERSLASYFASRGYSLDDNDPFTGIRVEIRSQIDLLDAVKQYKMCISKGEQFNYSVVDEAIKRTREKAEQERIKREAEKQLRKEQAAASRKEQLLRLPSILVTSGYSFEGYRITKYSGYISGDAVMQVDRGYAIISSGAANVGAELKSSLSKIRREALEELKLNADALGCNAVIGVDYDYITLEPETANLRGGTTYLPYVFCVTANGTAVTVAKDEEY